MISPATILSGPLAPGLVTAGLAVGLLPWFSRESEWPRACVIALGIILMWRYMIWRLLHSLPPLALSADFIIGIAFILTEFLTIAGVTATLVILARTRSRSTDADAGAVWLRARRLPLVDVFICTYNEEQTILETTIVAALGMDYPNFRVWVLDDTRRTWLKELCARKGCHYLTRPDNSYAKAGNINHGLAYVARLPKPPDLIAILDADVAPTVNFLSRSVSLFRDPSVGLVQTPQHFSNPDPIQSNLSVSQVFPDEQRYFFDVIMASRDAWGISFCCGTSSVIRFSALREVGGFPTESVTEDYLLTLRLREFGHRTVYLNERLCTGLAPEGLKEYATQRGRWCLGLIQICRGRYSPVRLANNLTWGYRIGLLESFLYWAASYPFRLFCVLIPILYWVFGIRAVHADLEEATSNYFPYFVGQVATMIWISQGRVLPIMADVSQLLVATDIIKAVAVGLVKPRGHKFKVTPKGGLRDKLTIQWHPLLLFVSLALMTMLGLGYAFILDDNRVIEEGGALCLFWSWYNLAILLISIMVCIEQPRYRKEERYPTDERAVLVAGGRVYLQEVVDISAGGMLLRGTMSEALGTPVIVAIGGLRVPAMIVRKSANLVALQVQGEEARDAMIRHVHSGRYGYGPLQFRGFRVAVKVLQRVFR